MNANTKINTKTSLKHQGDPLANASEQLVVLQSSGNSTRFREALRQAGHADLHATSIEILQVNLGKMCNMTCSHCHVDAGPDRKEIMQPAEIQACLDVLRHNPSIKTLDLTGGAPEMNPHFREMVSAAKELNRHVIDRCNLTILLAPGYDDLPEFMADHRVEIVASLPCYLEENTDAQRGDGAFQKSITALKKLNQLGYGNGSGEKLLTLVYNPVGPNLPPDQKQLEDDYREQLADRFGIVFDRLFTITNMPVSRYLKHLMLTGEYENYMHKLVDAFNPASVDGLMCRNTLSVGWDGLLFDCDFNQMLELQVKSADCKTIHDFDYQDLSHRQIVLGKHCFGCTAGSGSGCQGSIT